MAVFEFMPDVRNLIATAHANNGSEVGTHQDGRSKISLLELNSSELLVDDITVGAMIGFDTKGRGDSHFLSGLSVILSTAFAPPQHFVDPNTVFAADVIGISIDDDELQATIQLLHWEQNRTKRRIS
ncbi:MAG: hypothetical protein HQ478_04585 [Chloroflexi bacterium]|nr:hypothetical protein [Chloroflexota bacterium]